MMGSWCRLCSAGSGGWSVSFRESAEGPAALGDRAEGPAALGERAEGDPTPRLSTQSAGSVPSSAAVLLPAVGLSPDNLTHALSVTFGETFRFSNEAKIKGF